jgi:DNA polymerase III subunit delta'
MAALEAPGSAYRILERALERNRLAHTILLHGPSLDAIEALAHRLAERLLCVGPAAAIPLLAHPDLIAIRPAKKMRQISAESARELIRRVSHSPQVGDRKVGIIYEADRLHTSSANILLKTLEEPPAGTTLLVLSTRPYSLLPTIRSRCLHLRVPAAPATLDDAEARDWLSDFSAWLETVARGISGKSDISRQILSLYGLAARFGPMLEGASDRLWKRRSAALGERLGEDEKEALEAGSRAEARLTLFAELERTARDAARKATPRLGEAGAARALAETVDALERAAGLLRANLNEGAALEFCLLSALRSWSRKAD